MRESARIDTYLSILKNIWKKYPDLRFMQLIGNVFPHYGDLDPYYMEDPKSLKIIMEYYGLGDDYDE